MCSGERRFVDTDTFDVCRYLQRIFSSQKKPFIEHIISVILDKCVDCVAQLTLFSLNYVIKLNISCNGSSSVITNRNLISLRTNMVSQNIHQIYIGGFIIS